MDIKSASAIAQLLGPFLRAHGFVGRCLRWYRSEAESILLIDVQPARYSPGPYINLGVYYRKYGDADRPTIVECHLETRLMSTVPNPLRGDALLDTSNDIPQDPRREELEDMIRSSGIPWLLKMARFDDAKRVLAANPKAAHVFPSARADLIGTP